ncbi:MAG TPA: transglycosylase SLT domain-containing protein [Bacteroidota bacterium]|nr:transglycosylase SLT domain-containing protein [Bacteroidota bacterium]
MEPVNSTGQMKIVQSQPPLDAHQKLRLQNAVKEFEAVLVGYMLKSMRSGIPKEETSGGGFGADMLEGMFDIELARHISHSSNLGLGEMLYKRITGEDMPQTEAVSDGGAVRAVTASAARPGGSARITENSLSAPASSRTGAPGILAQPALPDTVRQRVESLSPIISDAAREHGVDAQLLKAMIATESAGRVTAQSSRNAKGLMQLIDSTAAAMGVRDVWDPRQNVRGGAKYLSQMLERFQGNVEHALASYNAGPGAVDKYQGVPPYKETQEYVDRVLQYLQDFEQQGPAVNDEN